VLFAIRKAPFMHSAVILQEEVRDVAYSQCGITFIVFIFVV